MDTVNNDDDVIVILSSDSENEDEGQTSKNGSSSGSLLNQKQTTTTPMKSQIKIENNSLPLEERSPQNETNKSTNQTSSSIEGQDVQHQDGGMSSEESQPIEPNVGFLFNAFALFGPENASMAIEDRLASFINNVESLTKEKILLENAERQARRQTEEATNQLATANEEISKLKEDLVSSQAKIHQQTDSISELKTTIDKLKKQESGSKSKLKSVTSTLMNLQAKMVQILEETEGDSPATVLSTSEQAASTSLALNSNSTANILLNEVILKENIENFEKDFETKFSQIEEQDQEIRNELLKTNEMLNRIQASLMEQFETEPSPAVSGSPQLTLESMENQDMGDEQVNQIPGSSASTSNYSSVVQNGVTKKVLQPEDSKSKNTLNHTKDPNRSFACICGVQYGTKFGIDRHFRMENGRKHFTCNICTASFFELCNLRRHYVSIHQLHYPSQVSGCSACGKIFNSFVMYKKHQKRCDGKEEDRSG